MDPFDLKDKIVHQLQAIRAPLTKESMPGYWRPRLQEKVLEELVAQKVIVAGPNIPHRTWVLPEFLKNPPKG